MQYSRYSMDTSLVVMKFGTLAASAGLTGVTAAEAGRIVTDLWLQACQAAEGKDS